jgi:predicted lipoprotein with Yx(FWY)xxD motif
MTRTLAHLLVAATAAAVLAGCGSPGGYGSSGSGSSSTSEGTGPETIGTSSGSAGTYLTADDGRAVFLFDADKSATSTCSGACANAWPPVLTDGPAKAEGSAKSADLGTTKRSDGTTQVTYQGHPLYYYAEDQKAGQTGGQGSKAFGASWWLVSPDGTALTGGASSSGGGYGHGY